MIAPDSEHRHRAAWTVISVSSARTGAPDLRRHFV